MVKHAACEETQYSKVVSVTINNIMYGVL